MSGRLGASEKARGGCSRGGLGVCLLPSLGGSSPLRQRESEREKRQPQGGRRRGGGCPKGWKGGGRATAHPALSLLQPQSWQEGEAEGSVRRSRGKQWQVTQGPSAAPEVGLGIEFKDW